MNIDCRVIGDLLPLYADESCSDASRPPSPTMRKRSNTVARNAAHS